MRAFPKLMSLKAAPDNLVVLFRDPKHGTVLHSDGEGFPPYADQREFDPDDFEDVDENIVIWLTEGPKEDVLKAIEIVDRIKYTSHVVSGDGDSENH